MEEKELSSSVVELKQSISVMVIRDILIEQGLITHEEFRNKVIEKAELIIEDDEVLSELKQIV